MCLRESLYRLLCVSVSATYLDASPIVWSLVWTSRHNTFTCLRVSPLYTQKYLVLHDISQCASNCLIANLNVETQYLYMYSYISVSAMYFGVRDVSQCASIRLFTNLNVEIQNANLYVSSWFTF